MTTTIIQGSLGEAVQVDRKYKSNQSPNAHAKGDLFCVSLTTETQRIQKLFVFTKENFVRSVTLW